MSFTLSGGNGFRYCINYNLFCYCQSKVFLFDLSVTVLYLYADVIFNRCLRRDLYNRILVVGLNR